MVVSEHGAGVFVAGCVRARCGGRGCLGLGVSEHGAGEGVCYNCVHK